MITTKSTFYSNRSIGSLRYLPFLIQELIGWDIEIDNLCFYMLNILCPSLTTPALFFWIILQIVDSEKSKYV